MSYLVCWYIYLRYRKAIKRYLADGGKLEDLFGDSHDTW